MEDLLALNICCFQGNCRIHLMAIRPVLAINSTTWQHAPRLLFAALICMLSLISAEGRGRNSRERGIHFLTQQTFTPNRICKLMPLEARQKQLKNGAVNWKIQCSRNDTASYFSLPHVLFVKGRTIYWV